MNNKFRRGIRSMAMTACAVAGAFALTTGLTGSKIAICLAQSGDQIPLPITLPKPVFTGTPTNAPTNQNVEKPLGHPRPIPMVPKGTINLALHKKVTASVAPFSGSLDLVTDGNKEAKEDTVLEIKGKLQWIQIDLGATSPLSYIAVWHFHTQPVIFHSVIVQVSDDPKFIDGVTTLFNNDQENTSGLGIGTNREYFETNEGKLIDAKSVKARYVRLYSRSSTYNDPLNRYTEVEVYGLPAK